MSSIIENIVNNDLCIGCGLCAGICPQRLLAMHFNIYGEYNPVLKQACSKECGLCMSVCPFNDKNMNETEIGRELFGHIEGINHTEETGYYLDSFVGYSPQFRKTSASGGMATWLLATLLEKKHVDYVLCVAPQENPEKLFSFQIFEDAESIIRSSGSAYYPVELSDMIKTILDKPGRYAVTGLPCFIKAIRLATARNQKLKERITFVIGLVCGQMKSKHYTTYLSELANAGGKLQKVTYRGKSPDKPANNFYFHCINQEGTEGKLFFKEGVSKAWVNRWFTPNACNYCDDVFAELADVVFMDAWLPEYIDESKGTNLLIVRSAVIQDLILDGIENKSINLNVISIDKLIRSQPGVISVKREQLPYRLYLAKKSCLRSPIKRVKASKDIPFFKKKEVIIKNQMQNISKNYYVVPVSEITVSIQDINKKMSILIFKDRCWKLVRNGILKLKTITKL